MTPSNIKKWSGKKVKFPLKLDKEILWDKLCVYIVGTYIIVRKGNKKYLVLKDVTMTDPVMGWFEITQ